MDTMENKKINKLLNKPWEILWLPLIVVILRYAPHLVDSLGEIVTLGVLVGGSSLGHIMAILKDDNKVVKECEIINISDYLNNADKVQELAKGPKKLNYREKHYSKENAEFNIVKSELVDEWITYIINSDGSTTKITDILSILLEKMQEGISMENIIMILNSFELTNEEKFNIIEMLIHFSLRGEELRNYWNEICPNNKIEDLKRER